MLLFALDRALLRFSAPRPQLPPLFQSPLRSGIRQVNAAPLSLFFAFPGYTATEHLPDLR